jgi:peroxiredoxin
MNKLFLFLALLSSTLLTYAQQLPKGLAVNSKAPDFTAISHTGEKINLQETLKKGAVVLVFYRGQWCPHCNRQLKKLEDSLSFITAKSASLIAVTPEKPDNIDKTIKKTKATYPVLHDEALTIMKAYDVAYDVDAATIERYKKYGIDFTEVNGTTNGARLPVPALFVIKQDGTIAYRHFNPDYTKRPSVAEILAAL